MTEEQATEEKQHAMYFDKQASSPGIGVVSCTCGESKTHHSPEKLAKWMRKHASVTGHNKVMGS